MIHPLSWQTSIWFFDIDDTLIDTAGSSVTASSGVYHVFAQHFSHEVATQIQYKFNDIFTLMLAGHQAKHPQDWEKVTGGQTAHLRLVRQIEDAQRDVITQYGKAKLWSREIFIKLAADEAHLTVTPELIHEAADAYWMTLTEHTHLFPGVTDLFRQIQLHHHRPIYLLTSSDARLKMDERGQFHYVPEYSEALKRERIELLRQKGINFNLVSIGDPQDKPHLDFFIKGIEMAKQDLATEIQLEHCIMCGDSFVADLQTPCEKLGFGLVSLFVKNQPEIQELGERYLSTGNLSYLTQYLR